MDIEQMTDEQIRQYLELRQQENPSDYSYQQVTTNKPGDFGNALVELDKDGNPRKSRQYLTSIKSELPKTIGESKVAQQSPNPTGVWTPDDWGKHFVDSANKAGYTDSSTGKFTSYNKGADWLDYVGKQITDPEVRTALSNGVTKLMQEHPNMDKKELKYRLRALENNLKKNYPNAVPQNFDISGKMLDSTMAKTLLGMDWNAAKKPAQPAQAQTAQTAQTQAPEAKPSETKTKGKQVANSNAGVAGANVGDYIIRSNGEMHVLTQQDIDYAKRILNNKPAAPKSNNINASEADAKAAAARANVVKSNAADANRKNKAKEAEKKRNEIMDRYYEHH